MMLKKGQVFVRAFDENGNWGNADVLNLNDESFRIFVVNMLMKMGVVAYLKDEYCEGEPLEYRLKEGLTFED